MGRTVASDYETIWEQWKTSLKELENLVISRMYSNMPLTQATSKELNIFCDASETAIADVAHTHLTDSSGPQRLGFILGQAKLAPKHGHTIPRLELCAAVLTTELLNTIHSELDIEFEAVKFFSDSKVAWGIFLTISKDSLRMSQIV